MPSRGKRHRKDVGRSGRRGLSLVQLLAIVKDEETAENWFIASRWPNGISCPHCESDSIYERPSRKPQRFRCRGCKRYFSPKTGTVLRASKIGYQAWVIALYLMATNLKGVSSMKLHRELNISQRAAWRLGHKIRTIWEENGSLMLGEVEMDETWVGGIEKNKHFDKRTSPGGGPKGKVPVLGIYERDTGKVRAFVLPNVKASTVRAAARASVKDHSIIYTDESKAYKPLEKDNCRLRVRHWLGEYVSKVNPRVHTNSIESFWSMLKRGYKGTYHHWSPRHLQRYVTEFAGRQSLRECDTLETMVLMVQNTVGKVLRYKDLKPKSV